MTVELVRATLSRVTATKGSGKDPAVTLKVDPEGIFPVQFNPTSLKVSRQNNIDHGPATTKGQKRQNSSPEPATLSLDLEFDTAEEAGPDGRTHLDVRTRTYTVRQFVEPNNKKPKEAPPLIRFTWGTFIFNGIVTQLTEDLDYFSPAGVPLRAKVSVVITEQNPQWEAKIIGAAARDAQGSTAPGGGPAATGPGAKPDPNPNSTTAAKAGESVQQVLSRLNQDPAAWRAAMGGLDSPLGLAAGAQVQLGAQVSAGGGLGLSGGFTASAGLTATASLSGALGGSAGFGAGVGGISAGGSAGFGAGAGLGAAIGGGASVGGGLGAGVSGGLSGSVGVTGGVAGGVSGGLSGEATAGFALAEGGGVSASLNTVLNAGVSAATSAARASFQVPAVSVSARATSSGAGASAGTTAASAAFSSSAPDPRALSFGASIPLSARVVVR